jgi:hypothetical protein
VVAKWLIAVPAFISALFWNYCGLICTKPELSQTSRLGHLAGAAAVFALLLSGSVGVWIASLKRQPPWSLGFVIGAIAAVVVGPALALASSPSALDAFERSSVQGAIVSLVGISLMVRPLLRVTKQSQRDFF